MQVVNDTLTENYIRPDESMKAQSKVKELRGLMEYELQEIFPEYTVSNVRVTVPERNTIKVEAAIGNYAVEFLGDPATLNKLRSQLNAALRDLGMASY